MIMKHIIQKLLLIIYETQSETLERHFRGSQLADLEIIKFPEPPLFMSWQFRRKSDNYIRRHFVSTKL